MIWIFLFILILPFLFIFYSVKNIGLADTYNGVQRAKDNLDVYSRVLKVCKHIAKKTTLVLEDLKYVDKNSKIVLDGKSERAYKFVVINALDLICDIQKIERKCSDIVNINLKNKNQFKEVIDNFSDKSDKEIIEWFIPEKDFEYFQDLNYTKKYIEKKIQLKEQK